MSMTFSSFRAAQVLRAQSAGTPTFLDDLMSETEAGMRRTQAQDDRESWIRSRLRESSNLLEALT
jgi:hypothetical protein